MRSGRGPLSRCPPGRGDSVDAALATRHLEPALAVLSTWPEPTTPHDLERTDVDLPDDLRVAVAMVDAMRAVGAIMALDGSGDRPQRRDRAGLCRRSGGALRGPRQRLGLGVGLPHARRALAGSAQRLRGPIARRPPRASPSPSRLRTASVKSPSAMGTEARPCLRSPVRTRPSGALRWRRESRRRSRRWPAGSRTPPRSRSRWTGTTASAWASSWRALDARSEFLWPPVGADVGQRVIGVTVMVKARTEKAAQEIATLALLDELEKLGMIGDY